MIPVQKASSVIVLQALETGKRDKLRVLILMKNKYYLFLTTVPFRLFSYLQMGVYKKHLKLHNKMCLFNKRS